jgi:hypothetical protein
MTEYLKCKHKTDGIIILDDNELSLLAYFKWAKSVGAFGKKELCWECWNKLLEKKKEK